MDRDLKGLLERGVDAFEKLASEIETIHNESKENLEVQPTPPKCPHCHDINPAIIVKPQEHNGPILEYGIQAQCSKCRNSFYVIFSGWAICKSVKDAQLAARLIKEEVTGERPRGNS